MRQKFYIYPFGIDGDITPDIPDPTDVGGLVTYQTGFTFDYQRDLTTDPAAKSILRININAILNDATANIADYQKTGSPEFITAANNGGVGFPYRIGSIVRYSPSGVEPFGTYISIVDNNIANPLGSPAWVDLQTGPWGPLAGNNTWTGTTTIEASGSTNAEVVLSQTGGGHNWIIASEASGSLDFFDATIGVSRLLISPSGTVSFDLPPIVPNAGAGNNPVALGQFGFSYTSPDITWSIRPDGLIEQVFQIAVPTINGIMGTSFTVPTAFPNGIADATICFYGTSPPFGGSVGIELGSTQTVYVTANHNAVALFGCIVRCRGT